MDDLAPRWFQVGRGLVAAVALIYLIPLLVLAQGALPARAAAGASAAVLVMAALYLWYWLGAVDRGVGSRTLALAALLVATTSLGIVEPPAYGNFLAPVGLIAGAAFGLRRALLAVVLVALHSAALDAVRGLPAANLVVQGVTTAFVGMIAIGGRLLVVSYWRLQAARAGAAELAVAQERLRVARDLHDSLGQILSAVILKSELAALDLPGDAPAAVGARLAEVTANAREALSAVRQVVGGMRRPTLAEEIASARSMLAMMGIDCVAENRMERLDAGVEAALAWAVREAATNIVRHSGARRCRISVEPWAEGVRLKVEDDGRGPLGSSPGGGLHGLEERIAAAGGRVKVGYGEWSGFALSVEVPA